MDKKFSGKSFSHKLFRQDHSFLNGFLTMFKQTNPEDYYYLNNGQGDVDKESVGADWHQVGVDLRNTIEDYAGQK